MRKMGLDLGERRIGIAFSDMLGIIANGYETYYCKNDQSDFDYIIKLIAEKEVDTIVIGLPLNMDGTSGRMVEYCRNFGQQLQTMTTAKIVYLDERLTSMSAEKLLIQADVRRDKRKQVIDKIAATIILQNYLDKLSK